MKVETKTPQQKVTGSLPDTLGPASLSRSLPGGGSACPALAAWRLWGVVAEAPPLVSRCPLPGSGPAAPAAVAKGTSGPSCRTCSPGAAFTVLEAAVFYQNEEGKATTFLFRVFSQIYRNLAFICLFIF